MKNGLVAERLRNHKLSSPTFTQPADVVRWFGAVQAQDFHGAKWAVALRMQKATNAAVEEAFNRGEILRTHLLRPTWHFITPEDIRWLLHLTAPRVNAQCGATYRKYELDPPVLKRSNRVLANVLKNGKHATRAELKAALNRANIAATDTVRFAHILLRAELDGVICSGPRRGNHFTYALLEERVAPGKSLSHDEALVELTRRYFTSHGPANLSDFVWWSGLTASDARRGIAMLDGEIETTEVEGNSYWRTNSISNPRRQSARSTARDNVVAHLLPAYDEYNVAYKNRQPVFDNDLRIDSWDALGPVVLINGRIVGTWKATPGKHSVKIDLKPARSLNQPEKTAIAKAAERYATFLDQSLQLT